MSRSLARGLGGCLRDALARGDAARAPRGALARPLARGFRGTATAGEEGEGDESSWTAYEDPSPITPWVRSVISGVELLRNPRYNKGMAFTDEERDKMHMKGLLPPAKFAQHTQVRRVMRNVRALTFPVEQHFHLLGLLERNERLFHRVLCEHYEELLPVMYAPTVGQVCKKFSVMFNRPRGLYITCKDRGEIHRILKNWPEKRVKLVVVTDGERVMGLGDLGVQGMGVAAAKTNLYTAAGGLDPSDVLAVCLDVGTNNRELLNDPLYIGNKHERTVGEAYDELLDEFVDAVKRRFGERCVIQFEDFSNANGKRFSSGTPRRRPSLPTTSTASRRRRSRESSPRRPRRVTRWMSTPISSPARARRAPHRRDDCGSRAKRRGARCGGAQENIHGGRGLRRARAEKEMDLALHKLRTDTTAHRG